jgi:hypothetical protein
MKNLNGIDRPNFTAKTALGTLATAGLIAS